MISLKLSMENTLMETLGIEVVEAAPDQVTLKMPVDKRTQQPMGYLHGGATVALAESAASIAGFLNIDPNTHQVFGIEINANHIKSTRTGSVYGTARPFHIGKRTMVWEIKVTDEDNELISISRCTVGVVPLKTS
ncbi:PaaI family thioesterase [Halobacillus sp. A5]|uniref:PaaI family thioesterase n=1 Tax=Halobacillus sp. A5 TaxID=2880263 RepID=UPI0020A6B9AE|nr:PaaI family thioesterase [Halobacillus sp. A5]MCP3028296.1 PaaI family thioesterase [Halobacillus sp. A5]